MSILALSTSGLLVFGFVFLMWMIGVIVNTKAKPAALQPASREMRELAEVRRRMLEQQANQKPPLTPRAKAKNKRNAAPPPLPTVATVVQKAIAASRAPLRSAPVAGEIGAIAPATRLRSQTSQNVRLLLQRNGLPEAFLLGEILGRPKGLD